MADDCASSPRVPTPRANACVNDAQLPYKVLVLIGTLVSELNPVLFFVFPQNRPRPDTTSFDSERNASKVPRRKRKMRNENLTQRSTSLLSAAKGGLAPRRIMADASKRSPGQGRSRDPRLDPPPKPLVVILNMVVMFLLVLVPVVEIPLLPRRTSPPILAHPPSLHRCFNCRCFTFGVAPPSCFLHNLCATLAVLAELVAVVVAALAVDVVASLEVLVSSRISSRWGGIRWPNSIA